MGPLRKPEAQQRRNPFSRGTWACKPPAHPPTGQQPSRYSHLLNKSAEALKPKSSNKSKPDPTEPDFRASVRKKHEAAEAR